jgi:hypothetical protein
LSEASSGNSIQARRRPEPNAKQSSGEHLAAEFARNAAGAGAATVSWIAIASGHSLSPPVAGRALAATAQGAAPHPTYWEIASNQGLERNSRSEGPAAPRHRDRANNAGRDCSGRMNSLDWALGEAG